jgi:hypothetical protein
MDEKSSGAIAFFLTFLLLFVSRQKVNMNPVLTNIKAIYLQK